MEPSPDPASMPLEKITMYDEFNIEVPEDEFPRKGISARAANALVWSDEWTDTNPMLNMSSFVTTFAEPEALETARRSMYKNYIDHDMYPQLFAMERRMVRWLHELWNGPKGVEPYGAATIGSSEACMLAGLAHKWNWRQAREKAGKDGSRPNMVTGSNVQIVWKKFLRYFDVEPRIVPLKPGNYRLTADQLDQYVDENTIAVVAIAGQTFTGEDDDIQQIHDWLDDYEKRTGVSIPMHIDGASGGFVNPFLYPDYKWDFRLPRVQSINASGHKFGLTPPGLGWVVFRERKIFNEDLIFYVNYLGGEMPTATLNFSRNAAPIAVQYYQFMRLGFRRLQAHHDAHAGECREAARRAGQERLLHDHERDAAHSRRGRHARSEDQELQRVRCLEQGARDQIALAVAKLLHVLGRQLQTDKALMLGARIVDDDGEVTVAIAMRIRFGASLVPGQFDLGFGFVVAQIDEREVVEIESMTRG
ncbi:Glutamate decarboxylase [Candidatus Burkholderia verschuerenii]|uniref:Glutamate decarboxylase n=1 Tax=Candidatus Burkholderia verschuerenii TaxID=242163 RepID=A0A0L0MH57_9BURK|nr:Glutamate decarboxylase [Candidatus Burkholderia verschuerenii]